MFTGVFIIKGKMKQKRKFRLLISWSDDHRANRTNSYPSILQVFRAHDVFISSIKVNDYDREEEAGVFGSCCFPASIKGATFVIIQFRFHVLLICIWVHYFPLIMVCLHRP